jgi:hypothetical protein
MIFRFIAITGFAAYTRLLLRRTNIQNNIIIKNNE